MEALTSFPVFLMLAILPLSLAVAAALQSKGLRRRFSPASPLAVTAGAILCVAVLSHVWLALLYLLSSDFADSIRPATAWLYALINKGSVAEKVAGFICLLLTYVLIALSVRQRFRGQWSAYIVALGYFSLFALQFQNYSFLSMPDVLLILVAALGLYSCLLRPGRIAWLVCGIALGMAVNGSVTGVIYFLPYLAWFFDRDGYRALLVTLLAAAVFALLPYLFVEQVPWQDYFARLLAPGSSGSHFAPFITNLAFMLFVIAPVGLFLLWQAGSVGIRSWFVGRRLESAGAVIAAILILAATVGADSGVRLLQPFAPVMAFLTAHAVSRVAAYRPATGWSIYGFWAPLAAALIAAGVIAVSRSL
jgi:hypothetical protein